MDLMPLSRDLQASNFADNSFLEVRPHSRRCIAPTVPQFVRKLAAEQRASDAIGLLQRVGRLKFPKQMELLGSACLLFAQLNDFASAQSVLGIADSTGGVIAPAVLSEYTGLLLRSGSDDLVQQAVRLNSYPCWFVR